MDARVSENVNLALEKLLEFLFKAHEIHAPFKRLGDRNRQNPPDPLGFVPDTGISTEPLGATSRRLDERIR
jgi:hypothetical protein